MSVSPEFNHILLGEDSASKAEGPGSNPGVVASSSAKGIAMLRSECVVRIYTDKGKVAGEIPWVRNDKAIFPEVKIKHAGRLKEWAVYHKPTETLLFAQDVTLNHIESGHVDEKQLASVELDLKDLVRLTRLLNTEVEA